MTGTGRTIPRNVYDLLAYQGPTIDTDRIKIEPFELTIDDCRFASMFGGRTPHPGIYHKLYINGALWMSDTTAERRDHFAPVCETQPGCSTLVNGLGMGLVVCAMIDRGASSVDVVEIDGDLIDAMTPWLTDYANTRGCALRIHHDDAYTIKWPVGCRWDVVWHDIWIDLCTDNLDDMGRLHRRYGRRAGWQGSWGKHYLRLQRQRDAASWW